jgi:hypothetical protein
MEQPPPEVAQDNRGLGTWEDIMFTLRIIRTHDFTGETLNFISRIEFETGSRTMS